MDPVSPLPDNLFAFLRSAHSVVVRCKRGLLIDGAPKQAVLVMEVVSEAVAAGVNLASDGRNFLYTQLFQEL